MANSIIKDFVQKQTTPISIGVPKQRTPETVPAPAAEPAPQAVQAAPEAPAAPQTTAAAPTKGRVGRPKSDIEKVKLSVYIPAEAKEKLVKIQHTNYKQSINDVLIEAVSDLIRKYGLQ